MEEKLINEDTIPSEEVETEQNEVTEETETTPKESENEETEAPEAEELFEITYNHQKSSVTKQEAQRLAQMGKYYEDKFKSIVDDGIIDDLDYFATLQGKDVKQLVKSLVDGVEQAYREELEDRGLEESEISGLLELKRQENRANYEKTKARREEAAKQSQEDAKQSAQTKIAEQFESIRSSFPKYDTIDKIPDKVFKGALASGDLEKELMRYELAEMTKINSAKAKQEDNKNKNIGSAQTASRQATEISDMLAGIWGR